MRGIFRDRRQRLRASSEAFPPLLANFLETDVSDRPQRCDELLAGLDRARLADDLAPLLYGGGAYPRLSDAGLVKLFRLLRLARRLLDLETGAASSDPGRGA